MAVSKVEWLFPKALRGAEGPTRTAAATGWLTLLGTAGLALVTLALLQSTLPLGYLGEWVWNRSPRPAPWLACLPALAVALAYAGFVAASYWLIGQTSGGRRAAVLAVCFPLLLVGGSVVQLGIFEAPLPQWGPERYATAIVEPAISGYFLHAQTIDNMSEYLAGYEGWLVHQDSFHAGTHPPGLPAFWWGLRQAVRRFPEFADRLPTLLPARFTQGVGIASSLRPLSREDQAMIVLGLLVTWSAGLLTCVPIYLLARLGAEPAAAWLAAALWPLIPAWCLFFPVGDTLYPLLAASAAAAVLWGQRGRLSLLAAVGGAIWIVGLFASMAFLAILPIIFGTSTLALVSRADEEPTIFRWFWTILAFAAGAALPCELIWHATEANLPVIWSMNLDKHAGFYQVMPRTYAVWIGVNLLEYATVLGPAVVALAARGLITRPSLRNSTVVLGWVALGTLLLLNFSGRNLSEVARLWILLMPFACAAAAGYSGRLRLVTVFGLLAAQAIIAIALQAAVEPLLPTHG